MSLSLSSRAVRAEGATHTVELRLEGNSNELGTIQHVVYNLGPTFDQPERLITDTASQGFPVEIMAFGDFTATAHVQFHDQRVAILIHSTKLPQAESRTPAEDWSTDSASWLRKMRSASARAALTTELTLFLSVVAFGWLLVAAWPNSAAVSLAGWQLPISLEGRLLVLAAAAGGLGALLQAALTLATYLGNRNVEKSWVGWYLLRAPTGMALGLVGYSLGVRAFLLSPEVGPSAVSPLGVTVLSLAIGFLSPRVTTRLQEIVMTLLTTASIDEVTSKSDRPTEPPAASPEAEREAQRLSDLALSQTVLRGKDIPVQEMFDLAERLRGVNEFQDARRLYGRIWHQADWANLGVTAVKVGQKYALSTYKDPDLPAGDRFTRALEILDEVDQLDFGAPRGRDREESFRRSARLEVEQRQESLGLRGAVYKRRWQIEAQHGDLEQSLGCYLKGYELGLAFPDNSLGVETDQGYTGINAAFVLELLAREEAKQSPYPSTGPSAARARFEQARTIRQMLSERLPKLAAQPAYSWLTKAWWFHSTLAEARFGLGDCDGAIEALRDYNRAHGLAHTGPPLEKIRSWEFESTLTQLSALTLLHTELTDLLEPSSTEGSSAIDRAQAMNRGRQALREYLGVYAPAIDRTDTGKLGLALSGGGFRASLFHIGVLAYLAERDMLRRVEVLSCVSGGSIVGAHLYLEMRRLLAAKPDSEVTRQDYLEIVERLERDFLAGVQTNIRGQVFSSIWVNLRILLQPGYTTTRRLGVLYERELYSRVRDGNERRPRYLRDLFVKPKSEPDNFRPKYDNWRRNTKVPTLVLNATTLNTGHNWQFTASWMGEPPIGLDAEIEGNYRLRRMYHQEAPRLKDRWRHWYSQPFAPPDYQHIRLGEAVAASSCVPGLFEPLVLPDLYDNKVVRLVDGGVHDNQGIASLLEQDCNTMIVSDASGQMEAQDNPQDTRLGVSMRSFSVSMTRVRQTQYRELAARKRSGLLKGLMFIHLKRDLDADPVDWRDCQDPVRFV